MAQELPTGIKLFESNDNVSRQAFNANFQVISDKLIQGESALVSHLADNAYQTAGGTATALTLTINGSLTQGYPINFVAALNNGGVTTTVNSKPLYKPNTITAPNLIAGKGYTAWYDTASGGRFFVKASAEGNTVAGHVLAGDTFSNDSDTGITGTMPNQSGDNKTAQDLHVYSFLADGAHNIFLRSPAGYYDGNTWIGFSDLDLKADNLRKGVVVGSGITITGTLETPTDISPFMSISGIPIGVASDGVWVGTYNAYPPASLTVKRYNPQGVLLNEVTISDSNFPPWYVNDDYIISFYYDGNAHPTYRTYTHSGVLVYGSQNLSGYSYGVYRLGTCVTKEGYIHFCRDTYYRIYNLSNAVKIYEQTITPNTMPQYMDIVNGMVIALYTSPFYLVICTKDGTGAGRREVQGSYINPFAFMPK